MSANLDEIRKGFVKKQLELLVNNSKRESDPYIIECYIDTSASQIIKGLVQMELIYLRSEEAAKDWKAKYKTLEEITCVY
jgi:hypothetical protein